MAAQKNRFSFSFSAGAIDFRARKAEGFGIQMGGELTDDVINHGGDVLKDYITAVEGTWAEKPVAKIAEMAASRLEKQLTRKEPEVRWSYPDQLVPGDKFSNQYGGLTTVSKDGTIWFFGSRWSYDRWVELTKEKWLIWKQIS